MEVGAVGRAEGRKEKGFRQREGKGARAVQSCAAGLLRAHSKDVEKAIRAQAENVQRKE